LRNSAIGFWYAPSLLATLQPVKTRVVAAGPPKWTARRHQRFPESPKFCGTEIRESSQQNWCCRRHLRLTSYFLVRIRPRIVSTEYSATYRLQMLTDCFATKLSICFMQKLRCTSRQSLCLRSSGAANQLHVASTALCSLSVHDNSARATRLLEWQVNSSGEQTEATLLDYYSLPCMQKSRSRRRVLADHGILNLSSLRVAHPSYSASISSALLTMKTRKAFSQRLTQYT
jgi:hypothetical protein